MEFRMDSDQEFNNYGYNFEVNMSQMTEFTLLHCCALVQ